MPADFYVVHRAGRRTCRRPTARTSPSHVAVGVGDDVDVLYASRRTPLLTVAGRVVLVAADGLVRAVQPVPAQVPTRLDVSGVPVRHPARRPRRPTGRSHSSVAPAGAGGLPPLAQRRTRSTSCSATSRPVSWATRVYPGTSPCGCRAASWRSPTGVAAAPRRRARSRGDRPGGQRGSRLRRVRGDARPRVVRGRTASRKERTRDRDRARARSRGTDERDSCRSVRSSTPTSAPSCWRPSGGSVHATGTARRAVWS